MKRLLLFVLMLIPILSAPAATAGRNMTKEAEIERQLQAINPELVEPFRNARIAFDRDDFAEAERLLQGVMAAAPNFDPAVRRLGAAMCRNGKAAAGLGYIRRAVQMNPSSANLTTLAYEVAFPKDGKASEDDQQLALNHLAEAIKRPDGQEEDVLAITAQLAFQTGQRDRARRAVELLQQKYPDLLATHFYSAYVAAEDEDWIKAENEMRLAEKLGLKHEAAQEFYDTGIHSRALMWRGIYGTGWTVLAWVIGLVTLCGLGFLLSSLTLRQIERSDPRVPVSPGEQNLRKVYRTVLNVAGFYYYISLPVVLLLVIMVSGAILYAFLVSGHIPIKLTVLIVIGVIGTIWTMGKSLLLRVQASDPGRPLERAEAEGLWLLSEEVARDLDTKPIDEIRITPGTDLCVYERGTWREKLDNRAKRVLVIGAAVLNGFKVSAFRSVLAHEYGHFSNRDTAGGDIALRVRNDMMKFYVAMLEAGQATALNLAFHFLRFYNFIFTRISHGATRLQEVLADRVAALHYGPASFEAGLRHVIRRHVDFDYLAEREINDAVKARQPVTNLYNAPDPQHESVQSAYAQAIDRPTTADDTHPGPKDRFRLIAGLPQPACRAAPGLVWDLFKNPDAIMQEMMAQVEKNIAPHRGT